MHHLAARPGYQRYWIRYTLISMGAIYGIYYLNKNHTTMKETLLTSLQSMKEFYMDHIGTPISQMVGEIFGGRRTHIADNNGLELAKKELEKSILDFNMNFFDTNTGKNINTLFPTLTIEEAKALAQKLDMRTITESYASTINRPFTGLASGELLRIMFIQVSYIKKELLSALSAIDNLLMDNQFNLAIVATIPGILLISGSMNFIQNMYNLATAPLDTSDIRLKLRLLMRDLYRLLTIIKIDQGKEQQNYTHHQHCSISTDNPSTSIIRLPKSSLYATAISPCTCSCICGTRETLNIDSHWIFANLPMLLDNASKESMNVLTNKEFLSTNNITSTTSTSSSWIWVSGWFKNTDHKSTIDTQGNTNYSPIKLLSSPPSASSFSNISACDCCACERIGHTTLLTYELAVLLNDHFRRIQPLSNSVTNTLNGISWSEYVRLCEDILDLCKSVTNTANIRTNTKNTNSNIPTITNIDVDTETALATWHRLHSTYSILGGHGSNDYSILSRLTKLT